MKLALADLQSELPAGAVPKLRILVEDDRSKVSVATRIAVAQPRPPGEVR